MIERSQKEVWKITPWIMVALLLGNFVLMAYDARQADSSQRMLRVWTQAVADFVQSPVTSISSSVSSYFRSISSLRSAQTENDRYKEQIQKLEIEVQTAKNLFAENERLKSLLELKEQSAYTPLFAQIIGRDASAWFDTSIINRGSLDGVKLNMPVVTSDGLVGRITAVSPLTAQVDLITKSKSGVGAVVGELGTSNTLGVITGSGKNDLLEMGYVPGSVEVQVGEIVYTTGQDGIYPAGLKLGEVVEVREGSATVSKQIFVKPSAGISSMQEVAILLYEPPPRPKYEEMLPNAVKNEK